MPIATIQPGSNPQRPLIPQRRDQDQGFAALLDNLGTPAPESINVSEPRPPDPAPLPSADSAPSGLIPLGEINAATPSVSHLLINHPELRHECWDIILAEVNQGKEFRAMRPGVQVSLNPTTKELVWSGSGPSNQTSPSPRAVMRSAENSPASQTVLGTISAETPTVSHLLTNDPRFSGKTWEIIFSSVNQGKQYASLEPGAVVTINPETLELSLPTGDPPPANPTPVTATTEPALEEANPELGPGQKTFAERLAESVKSYLGQSYRKIDCYGLVVRGLKDLGVQYGGIGGLRQQLEGLAREQGLPSNAYQTGEGLIEVAGQKLFDQSFARVSNPRQQSQEVMAQLEPLLKEGMLLSFSTPFRGHTGVVSKKDGQWTYVNSGMIDHQVDGGRGMTKRVGEETLAEEIKNWFVLAKNHSTSLQVSAGLFDTEKLKAQADMVASNRLSGKDLL